MLSKRGKKWLLFGLRLVIVAVALVYLALNTDWPQLKQVWIDANKWLLVLGIAAFGPCTVLIALRLKWLLAVHDVHLTAWEAIKATFTGNFIFIAVPVGTTGGDSVKAFYIARNTPHKHEAVTTVFFDRLVGVAGLLLLSGAVLLVNWGNPAFAGLGQVIAVLVLAMFVGAVIFFSNRMRKLFRLDAILDRLPLAEHLRRIDRAVFAFRHHRLRLLAAFGVTVLLQLDTMLSVFFMGWALGLIGEGPLQALPVYLGYVPIALLAGGLPIGAMEITFQGLLATAAGLGSVEAAVSLSLMGRVMQLVWALPGAYTVLKGRLTSAPTDLIEEETDPHTSSHAALGQ
jgi:hypothetical protein